MSVRPQAPRSGHNAVMEPMEKRQLLSISPSIVEVPISAAAKNADPSLNDYKTFDVRVTVSSDDHFRSGELKLVLAQGSFYIPPQGNSNTAQASFWSLAPNLEFDTFVSKKDFGSPTILGSYQPASGSAVFSSNEVNVTWGDLNNAGGGTFTIARLTMTSNASGFLSGQVFAANAPVTAVPFAQQLGAATTGLIRGTVFNDLNSSSKRDAGEPGLQGFRIYIDNNNNGRWDKSETFVRSDSNGNYELTNLPPGEYRIRETPVAGWRRTTPSSYNVNLTAGGTSTKHFGQTQNIYVSGTVFRDNNGDGKKQSKEGGLGGWRVYIDSNNNGVFDAGEKSVLTSSNGVYEFFDLGHSQTHIVRVVENSTWRRTTQSSFWINLGPGEYSFNKNFGYRKTA